MSDTTDATRLSGGCQCGAVRYVVTAAPEKVGVCHCRMCQKAAGAPFGVFAVVANRHFAWTRGAPAAWPSSSRAERLFCKACGTPLAYRLVAPAGIELMTGTFDRPELVPPTYEVGREGKLAWIASLPALPGKSTLENMGADKLASVRSFQHPDHDTP